MAIGICDWGIGGIGLYKLIREKCDVDVIYFSDSGFTPYGKVPQEELKERIELVRNYFHKNGISQIAIACNAASTVVPADKNMIGIIEHGINAVKKISTKEIAVVGGVRTIESEIYKTAFEKSGIKTTQRIAQKLSARIEAGDISSNELEKDIDEIFEPIKNAAYILLACTHYPVIAEKINSFATKSTLIDPAIEMCNWIFSNWENLSGTSNVKWLTTGDATQMKLSAEKSFGVEIKNCEKIIL